VKRKYTTSDVIEFGGIAAILRGKTKNVIASQRVAMTESAEMLTKTPHLFDDATRVTAGDSRWQGRTSDDYWAFVGPFGGATAATILWRLPSTFARRSRKALSISMSAWSKPTGRRSTGVSS
jgi:hypothetical protein